VTIPQVLRQTTFAVLVLVLIQNPAQLHWLPWIEGAAVVLLAVVNTLLYLHTGGRPVIDLRHGWSRELVSTSIPIGMSQMIWAVRMYFPVIILGVISGQEAVGYFGPPHRIVMVLLALLAVYFLNIFPSMSQASFNSALDLQKLMNSSIRFILWPSIILAGIITVFAQPVVGLVFGELYARSITVLILQILIWLIPVTAVRGHTRNALISLNYQSEELYCSIFGLGLLIGGILILAPVMSGAGVAWAMLLSEIIATILTWWRIKVHLPDIRFSENLLRLPSLAVFSERTGKL
jgi:O-antigen/teichoic acid export membrane protein